MMRVSDFSVASVAPFVVQNVVGGTTVITDGRSDYGPLGKQGFRHNRRKSGHVGKVFYKHVQGFCEATPQPYWKLAGREAPEKPLNIVVT